MFINQKLPTRISLVSFLFILIFPCIALPASSEEKTVLVIESYHKEMFWDAGYRNGIQDTLKGYANVIFFEMDTKRRPKSEYPARTKAAIDIIDSTKPDVVMLGDDNALNYVGKHVVERNLPLVFLGINANPRMYFGGLIPKNVTGVLERPLLKRHLSIIKEINPNWKKVIILFDDSNTSRIYKNDPFFFGGKNHANYFGMDVEIYLNSSYEKMQEKVMKSQTEGHVLFIGGLASLNNSSGQNIDVKTAIAWIYDNSATPLFGFWRGNVGARKSAGGYVIDGYSMGEQAAKLAKGIINDPSNATQKNLTQRIERLSKGTLVFNKAALKHWNITLPQHIKNKAEYIE